MCTPLTKNTRNLPQDVPLPKESTIIDATCVGHVLHILFRHKGTRQLMRCFLKNSVTHCTYTDVGAENTDFIITDAQVALWLRSSGDIELFPIHDIHAPKRVLLSALRGSEQLCYTHGQVLSIYERQLSHIRMAS